MASGEMVDRSKARAAMDRLEDMLRADGRMATAYGVRMARDILMEMDSVEDPRRELTESEFDVLRRALTESGTVTIIAGERETSIHLPTPTLNAARAAVGLEPL